MVETLKISEMTDGGDFELNQIAPVLESGANRKVSVQLQFSETGNTAQRPNAPPTPTIRYNTDFEQFEYFDSLAWVQLGSSGDVALLIARLAAHTVGDGASMIGLENQGSVTNKTAQDMSEADFVVKSVTSSLVNGFALSSLSTGFISVQTGTGNLIARTLTGAADQIDISNGTGLSANPQISFAANPQMAGTSNTKIPFGTTGQRPVSAADGMIRYNTTTNSLEFYSSGLGGWQQTSTTVGSVSSIIGTASQITASNPTGNVTLAIASNPVLPGTGGVTLPGGTIAQRAGASGTIRFNSQTTVFEGTLDGAAWSPFSMAAGTVVSVSGTAGRITSTGGTTPVIDIDAAYIGQSSINTVGTLTGGTWQANIIQPTFGGTGVNNGTNSLALAGNLTTSGAFASTFTMTGVTGVTFPTSGTLATTSQLPTPAALTKTDDTNVTLTLGGTPATALLQATSITMGWAGQLAVARGGTGLASATAYAVLCGGTSSTNPFQSIASVGSAGQVLTSNGAAALPTMQTPVAGTVNIVQTTKTDTQTVTSATFVDITSFSVSITPSASTSKVLIMVSVNVGQSAGQPGWVQLVRGSSPIFVGDAASNRTPSTTGSADGGVLATEAVTFCYLDSPATTSSTTYKVQIRGFSATAVYVNRTATDSDLSTVPRNASGIIVMEVKQ